MGHPIPSVCPLNMNMKIQFHYHFITRGKSNVDDLYETFLSLPKDGKEAAEIVDDKRIENAGRPEGNFDTFYWELDGMLEEFGEAAEERESLNGNTFTICSSSTGSN